MGLPAKPSIPEPTSGLPVTTSPELIPLCISVAVVYKTIRVKKLRRLPVAVAGLIGYMLVGLVALGAALWATQRYWP